MEDVTAPGPGEGSQQPERDSRIVARVVVGVVLVGVILLLIWLLWPRSAMVPKIIGMSELRARDTIERAGFQVGVVGTRTVDTTSAGQVVGQLPPPGIKLSVNAVIDFTVAEPSGAFEQTGTVSSGGSIPTSGVVVPNVIGNTANDARLRLEMTSLGASVGEEPSAMPIGDVVYQNPPPGAAVAPATVVQLTLSSGTSSRGSAAVGWGGAWIPDVEGLSLSRARSKLAGSGFGCRAVYAPSVSTGRGLVFWQSAGPGASSVHPSTIEVWISTGAPKNGFPYKRPRDLTPQ